MEHALVYPSHCFMTLCLLYYFEKCGLSFFLYYLSVTHPSSAAIGLDCVWQRHVPCFEMLCCSKSFLWQSNFTQIIRLPQSSHEFSHPHLLLRFPDLRQLCLFLSCLPFLAINSPLRRLAIAVSVFFGYLMETT